MNKEKEVVISVIIPVYNEEGNLDALTDKLVNVLGKKLKEEYEIIFVDDGSIDHSWDKIKEICSLNKQVFAVKLSRNFGKEIALSAGIDYVCGNAVIMMDADLQHPPELIPKLIEKWKEGYDIVGTIRRENRGYGMSKKIASRLFYILFNKISKINVPSGSVDFRLLNRPVVESVKSFKERSRFIRGLMSWVGYRKTYISYIADVRYSGSSKYSFVRSLKLALTGIVSFSAVPLYISTFLGIIIASASFLYGFYAIYIRFFTNQFVPGWTSILASVLFLGGVQLIAIGILGEYLAKIYEEVKQRPLYIVEEVNGFNRGR